MGADSRAAAAPQDTGTRWRTLARRAASIAIAVGVCAGIGFALRGQDWSVALEFIDRSTAGWVALAGAVNVAALMVSVLSWRALAQRPGRPLAVGAAARIFLTGLVVGYLPGRVWTVLAITRMGAQSGLAASRMVGVYLLNTLVGIGTAVLVGLVIAPAVLGAGAPWAYAAAVPVLVLFARPQLVNRALSIAAKVLRRELPETRFEPGPIRRSMGLQTLAWIITGHHLWILAVAAGAPPGASYLLCVGVFGLSLVTGLLVIVVPLGLGVREAVLVAALSLVLPPPMAVAVAVTSRVVTTLGDIGAALAAYAWSMRTGPDESGQARREAASSAVT